MKRIVVLVLCLALGAVLVAPAASARVLPADTRLYGAPYKAWLAHWWTAAAKRSLAAETSLLATAGNRCGLDTGLVWFLPASINGLLDVSCTIPRGHHDVVNVAGVAGWNEPPENLVSNVNSAFGTLDDWSFTVDGRARRAYVVKTAIFPVTVGPGSVLGEAPGTYNSYTKARFAILSPLRPGEHTVSTFAHFTDGFTAGMTFHLTVR
jgi:hypothetical protein